MIAGSKKCYKTKSVMILCTLVFLIVDILVLCNVLFFTDLI